MMTEW